MSVLYLTGRGERGQLTAAAALRRVANEKLVAFAAEPLGMDRAYKIVQEADAAGFAFVAEGETLPLAAAMRALRENGLTAAVYDDHEQAEARLGAKADTAAGLTPEQVFAKRAPGVPAAPLPSHSDASIQLSPEGWATALVALNICAGQPLAAASHIVSLARNTGHPQPFNDAVNALMRTFPWVIEPLRDNGLID